jgi:hypothetical protein
MARSVPATRKAPSSNPISAAATSRKCPASSRPLAMTASAAARTAALALMVEREPPLTSPAIRSSLSPCLGLIR